MSDDNKILLFDDPEEFLIFMDYLEQQYKKSVNETVKNNNNSGVGRECH